MRVVRFLAMLETQRTAQYHVANLALGRRHPRETEVNF